VAATATTTAAASMIPNAAVESTSQRSEKQPLLRSRSISA
jgi:hypothetical protein